jgi:hypothetical protein
MQYLLFLILFVLSALPLSTSAQATLDLKVKGVGVGTTYSTVLKKLGKPLLIKKGNNFPCDNEESMLTLQYSGLAIELIQDGNRRYYFVAGMKVTSPKWVISGITIGANKEKVQKRFGRHNKLGKEEGLEYLNYYVGDGYGYFYFRNNKLIKIEWELNIC